jgi:hypothetical protein
MRSADDLDIRLLTVRPDGVHLERARAGGRRGDVKVPSVDIAQWPIHSDDRALDGSPVADRSADVVPVESTSKVDARAVRQCAGSRRIVAPVRFLWASEPIASSTARLAAIAVVSAWS